jgi:hypothetical protein
MNALLPYWLGVPECCFYQEFQSGIISALREFGHRAFRFPFQKRTQVEPEEAKLLVRLVATARIDIVLDLPAGDLDWHMSRDNLGWQS